MKGTGACWPQPGALDCRVQKGLRLYHPQQLTPSVWSWVCNFCNFMYAAV